MVLRIPLFKISSGRKSTSLANKKEMINPIPINMKTCFFHLNVGVRIKAARMDAKSEKTIIRLMLERISAKKDFRMMRQINNRNETRPYILKLDG